MEKQKAENSMLKNLSTKDPKQERLPFTNDSGIEFDLEDITQELKNKVEIYVHNKLGIKTSEEISHTVNECIY